MNPKALAWLSGSAACLVLAASLAVNAAAPQDLAGPAGEQSEDLKWFPGEPMIRAVPRFEQGRRVYESVCKVCHGAGVARAPAQFILSLMPPGAIVRALTTGVMRTQGEALSAGDRVAVAQFLSGRPLATKSDLEPPACAGKAAEFDFDEPPPFAGWGIQPSNARYIDRRTAGLGRHNVGRLRLKWALGFDGATKARSQAAVAGGAIYVGSDGGNVYALDRSTGCARWVFAAGGEVRTGIVVSSWRAGDLAARPLVYFGDVVGYVYAVDAISGALIWRDRADAHPSTTLTAAPALDRGRLYVPVSSLEEGAADGTYPCCTFRGSMVAYDAMTGKRLWQSYLVDEPKQIGTYANGLAHHGPSGVALWNTPAIDARRGLMYFGTGDNYSTPTTGTSDAVIAMELGTGTLRWINQVTSGDAWHGACTMPDKATCMVPDAPDFDFGAASILARTTDGRELIVSGQKSGWVYAMNPDDGAIVWKTPVGRGGIMAGVYFGMSVQGDRLYVPVSDPPDGKTYEIPAQPGLHALDLKTGRFLWRSVNDDSVCKGRGAGCASGIAAPATATDDLVFTGASDGRVRIYDATTGKVLWQFDTARNFHTVSGGTARGGSIGGGAGPIVYDGTLIVASGYSFSGRMPGNVMLVFTLD